MCQWKAGGWSALYDKCKLNQIQEVNYLEGESDITKFCNETAAPEILGANKYAEDPILCLANNFDQCHWNNFDKRGLQSGGWSEVYMKCHLYNIPEVNGLQGSEQITQWCDEQKEKVNPWRCLQENADMCHWG